jgi:methionyl-tRNA formyltransferase
MHGVTIHKMDPAIDAGPIVYQSVFPIEEEGRGFVAQFQVHTAESGINA